MTAFIDEHREEYGVEPICRVLPIAPCQRHCKNPRKWQSKIPHFAFGHSGCGGLTSIFGWATAAARFDQCGRRNSRIGPYVLGQQIGMATQAVT